MLVTYLYLCVHLLPTLYLCGTLLHRRFHFGLGMIATSHIHCVYQSMFLVSAVACLLLYWELVRIFSVSFSIASNCGLLTFFDMVS